MGFIISQASCQKGALIIILFIDEIMFMGRSGMDTSLFANYVYVLLKKATSILRKKAQTREKNLFDKLYVQISFASSECETFKYRTTTEIHLYEYTLCAVGSLVLWWSCCTVCAPVFLPLLFSSHFVKWFHWKTSWDRRGLIDSVYVLSGQNFNLHNNVSVGCS